MTRLQHTVAGALSLVDNVARTIETQTRAIESIINTPDRWSDGVNTRDVRHQETVMTLNEASYALRTTFETAAALN